MELENITISDSKLTDRLAGKSICDSSIGDSSIVGITGMVDKSQGGIGQSANPDGSALGEVDLVGEDVGGLVGVVVGGSHEVMEDPTSSQALIIKLKIIILWEISHSF